MTAVAESASRTWTCCDRLEVRKQDTQVWHIGQAAMVAMSIVTSSRAVTCRAGPVDRHGALGGDVNGGAGADVDALEQVVIGLDGAADRLQDQHQCLSSCRKPRESCRASETGGGRARCRAADGGETTGRGVAKVGCRAEVVHERNRTSCSRWRTTASIPSEVRQFVVSTGRPRARRLPRSACGRD